MANDEDPSDVSPIVLPSEAHVVFEWKVQDGSPVQKGDIVAMASLQGTSATASVSSIQYRRPKMRMRKRKLEGESVDTQIEKEPDAEVTSSTRESLIPIAASTGGILRIVPSPTTRKIGTIEPCKHPVILPSSQTFGAEGMPEGLCAVCGMSVKPKEFSSDAAYLPLPKEAPRAMSQVTVSGGLTMSVSANEAQSLSIETSKRLSEKKKLHLVLDLDHTLVHATADPRAQQYLHRDDVRSLILPINENGAPQGWAMHCVKLRPHVKEFLSNPNYEISVYTAGTRLYAEQITVVLSRYMVGARNDHQDILKLQHQVKNAEHDLKELQMKEEQANTESKEENGEGEQGPGEGEQGPAKKRVRFGEPPDDLKTDKISRKELEKFKAELKAAEEMEAKALQLRQQLFGSRIVSRTDVADLGREVKSVKRIFPCGGEMAVIVDDREDVWANAESSQEPPDNLLLLRPYHWKPFLGFADVNNAAGADLSQTNQEEVKGEGVVDLDEADDQLLWTRDILNRLHDRFYGNSSGTVKTCPQHLRTMRQEVLEGSNLALSGLVPLQWQNREAKKPRPPFIRYAEQLGAQLHETVVPELTHVVAARDGSDKIKLARCIPGCFVVKASWLMDSLWSLTRRDEMEYLLGPAPRSTSQLTQASKKNGISTSILLQGEDSEDEDEDDDDLLAELENGVDHEN